MSRTARQAMDAAVKTSRYVSEEHWCQACLESRNPEIPKQWKLFAAAHLASLHAMGKGGPVGRKAWAYALKARHEAGEKLENCQIDAYKEVLGDEPKPIREQEGREPA